MFILCRPCQLQAVSREATAVIRPAHWKQPPTYGNPWKRGRALQCSLLHPWQANFGTFSAIERAKQQGPVLTRNILLRRNRPHVWTRDTCIVDENVDGRHPANCIAHHARHRSTIADICFYREAAEPVRRGVRRFQVNYPKLRPCRLKRRSVRQWQTLFLTRHR